MSGITNMMARVKSLQDLELFLRIHAIEEKGDIKTIWNSMTKPVLISKKKLRYFTCFSSAARRRSRKNQINKIVHVWQKGNIRYVLWNSKTIEICSPENPVYNFLDKGNHEYEGVMLLFSQITPDIESAIRKHWKRSIRHTMEVMPRISLTLDEFRANICSPKQELLNMAKCPERAKQGIIAANKTLETMGSGSRITANFLETGGKRFGIEEKELDQYAVFSPEEFGKQGYWENHDEIHSLFFNRIAHGIKKHLCDGNYVLWAGNYSVSLKKAFEKNMPVFWLESRKIHRFDIVYALKSLFSIEEKSDACNFLENIEKIPNYCSEIISDGIVARPFTCLERNIIVIIPVKRKGDSFFLSIPETGEEFIVKGGITELSKLEFMLRERRMDIFEMYDRLSKFIPVEKIDFIVETSKKKTIEMRKRAVRLLQETIEKNNHRITEKKMKIARKELPGFVVKGDVKNYFISKNDCRIYTFPEARYVCIVDEGEGRALCLEDRLVSRIYMLMNDREFSEKISTLNDYEEMDNIDIMDFDGMMQSEDCTDDVANMMFSDKFD